MLDIAAHAAELFDITITPEQVAALDTLHAELIDWNERMNLTAITEPDAVRIRHFLDSISLGLVADFSAGLDALDVGTGAGFPGLVVAILYPQSGITLMDSTGKKLKFIDHMIDKLGLQNARTVHARAEEAGRDPAHREQYDLVVARAVARLPALLEYCLPFVREGGAFVAMKGSTAFEEVDDSDVALRVLGGRVEDVVPVRLPEMEYDHHLITVSKIKPTPDDYPRSTGIPTREPITD